MEATPTRPIGSRLTWVSERVIVARKPGNAGGAKGPHFGWVWEEEKGEVIDVSLTTPSKIRELRNKLYEKAKQEPNYRFYLLYDKIHREDILAHAYDLSRAKNGAPGVDGQSFAGIENGVGRDIWLANLRKELQAKTYQPMPVRRVMIPKPVVGNGP